MNAKRQLGQFFTTNSDYILSGFSKLVRSRNVRDPFAGSGELVDWANKNGARSVIGFDVDNSYVDNKTIFKNDSINNPKKYDFVLTNPPYLHKNKANENIKDKYFAGANSNFEDLYQVSIKSILNSKEGIVIVPLNFLSAENSEKIRRIFFDKFTITRVNVFAEQVFNDTTYNVISFHYKEKNKNSNSVSMDTFLFPEKTKIKLELKKEFGWQMGGEFAAKINSTNNFLGIYRLTTDYLKDGPIKLRLAFNNIKNIETYNLDENLKHAIEKNILFLRAIDSKNGKKIQLEDIRKYCVYGLVGKNTSRNMAHLLLRKPLTIDEQKKLIVLFNKELRGAREKYSSLFLTNFRDNNRKRISFEFAYKLLNYIYLNKLYPRLENYKFNFGA
ncbi:MAG: hypothetical protein UU81_C0045G0007 [Microgenomates group bacterium GW2011_GWC1_41_8]|nr:MAG: hypothetical protein UU81_C0045G0007 [Microgenomates group bacterium GW2011_GWC1_41_8]KKT75336.1 MAG: hypothetical protein UW71_C0004G0027 [Parcubacteria group bacterium GW2011_GWB1_44_7]